MVGLKLDGGGFDALGAFFFAAAAASASILAALNAALLFVLGAIEGGKTTLLGRGRGFAATLDGLPASVAAPFAPAPTSTSEREGFDMGERTLRAEDALRAGVRAVEGACDGVRDSGADCRRELPESAEFVREIPGAEPRTVYMHKDQHTSKGGSREPEDIHEVGGAAPPSFDCLNAALLFNLGATVGGLTLATLIVSRLLWPGTPSNVALAFSVFSAADTTSSVTERFLIAGATGLAPFAAAASLAIRNEAALVMRGAIAGGATDATAMVSLRLCPGTFANVWASRSFESGARGLLGGVLSTDVPVIRRAAARDMRGTISGWAFVTGTGRALNEGFPLDLLLPLTVEALVLGAYPVSLCSA